MRSAAIVLAVLVAFAGVATLAPTAQAGPPNIGSGCDYFHWHNGNVAEGQAPGYHWHPCL